MEHTVYLHHVLYANVEKPAYDARTFSIINFANVEATTTEGFVITFRISGKYPSSFLVGGFLAEFLT